MTADVPDPNTPPRYPAPLSGGYPTQPPVFPVETAADRVPYPNPATQNPAAQNPPIGLPGSISYAHPLRPPPTPPPPPAAPLQSGPLQSASQPVVRTVGAALQKMAARGQLATMSLIAFVVFGLVLGGWWWAWLFFLLPTLVEANRRRR